MFAFKQSEKASPPNLRIQSKSTSPRASKQCNDELCHVLQENLAELEGNEDAPEKSEEEAKPLPELQEVDPFASSAPSGFVETERDRLIRLVRLLHFNNDVINQSSCRLKSCISLIFMPDG